MPNDAQLMQMLEQIQALGSTGLLLLAALAVALALPPLLVLFSRRVEGSRKIFWFVMTGTFSWLAYLPFLLLTRSVGDAAPGGAAKEG